VPKTKKNSKTLTKEKNSSMTPTLVLILTTMSLLEKKAETTFT